MAGHSKWANIQHRKSRQDAKRGKLFTRLAREITVAARMGGPDPVNNAQLRLAVEKARAQSLPKDNINRAISRGTSGGEGADLEEVTYEGYSAGGAAILLRCLTDNRNRTVAEVRHGFSRHGGNLGADGAVAYLFNEVAVFTYSPGSNETAIIDAAIEGGAEDVVSDDDGTIEVLADPRDFSAVLEALRGAETAAGERRSHDARVGGRAAGQQALGAGAETSRVPAGPRRRAGRVDQRRTATGGGRLTER